MIGDPPGYEIDKAIAVLRFVWWWNAWSIHHAVFQQCRESNIVVKERTAWCDNCGRLWERSADGRSVDLSVESRDYALSGKVTLTRAQRIEIVELLSDVRPLASPSTGARINRAIVALLQKGKAK